MNHADRLKTTVAAVAATPLMVIAGACAIASAVVIFVVGLPVLAALLLAAGPIAYRDHRRRKRAAGLAAVLGYRDWSGRVEDLPTIGVGERNAGKDGAR